jgi:hypothetical protein
MLVPFIIFLTNYSPDFASGQSPMPLNLLEYPRGAALLYRPNNRRTFKSPFPRGQITFFKLLFRRHFHDIPSVFLDLIAVEHERPEFMLVPQIGLVVIVGTHEVL